MQIESLIDKTPATWAAAGSTAIAFLALLIALISLTVSALQYSLAKNKDRRSKPKISIYYSEGFSIKKENERIYAFLASVTNSSEISNSISNITLEIIYLTPSGAILKYASPICGSASLSDVGLKGDILKSSFKVEGQHTVTGWALFSIHDSIIHECTIQSFEVKFYSVSGQNSSFNSIMIKDKGSL